MSPKLGTGLDPAGVDSVTGHEPAHRQIGPVDFGVLLGQVFAGEPPIGHGVAAVYQRADRMRRRRLQAVAVLQVASSGLM